MLIEIIRKSFTNQRSHSGEGLALQSIFRYWMTSRACVLCLWLTAKRRILFSESYDRYRRCNLTPPLPSERWRVGLLTSVLALWTISVSWAAPPPTTPAPSCWLATLSLTTRTSLCPATWSTSVSRTAATGPTAGGRQPRSDCHNGEYFSQLKIFRKKQHSYSL